ncbi:fatty acid desaturase [Pseudomonas sp. RIT623]|uniref:fatty acid desaturase family protein n=1 Tax=Pseudomonas sp. RIT623 TaxID=2559075 RepID=UPI00106FDA3F|nr:fatty acid desaturase [Pseudomonas sp. RIT623]TFF41091.1 hypothetical protein E3U47_11790 [Pseudomonas sp. RIT623]
MRPLPGFLQPFLSWLSAKPLPEELETPGKRTPLFHVGVAASFIILGVLLTSLGYYQHSLLWWLPGFVLAAGGIKQMQVMICHNCAHDMVFASRRANTVVGHVISALFMLKPYTLYKHEHMLHHSSRTLLTDQDDTLTYLQGVVGLKPTDSIAMMWAKLLFAAFSPLAILRTSLNRIKANATATDRGVAALTMALWAGLTLGAWALGQLQGFIAAWVLPVFIGYHISTTFRLAAEHTWPSVEVLEKRGVDFICDSTTSVFIGEPLNMPDNAQPLKRILCISRWLLKTFTYHLFVRLFIMVGDTPCHDFHHRRPRSSDWPNYVTARERDKLLGAKPFPRNYIDKWGYVSTVTDNFRNFQKALPYYQGSTFNALTGDQ